MLNEILVSIVKHSIFFSILSVLFERLLIKFGFTRGNTILLLIQEVFLIILMQFVSLGKIHGSSFIIYFFAVVFVLPISANRYDIMGTMNKGRWWWRSEIDL